jgi:hypothetical protein
MVMRKARYPFRCSPSARPSVASAAALAFILAFSHCAASPEIVLVEGATRQEHAELQEGPGHGSDCLRIRTLALDAVLRAHPNNRAALILRAQAAVELGNTVDATADLARLKSIDPDFPWIASTRASLARVKGQVREELAAYAAMGTDRNADWSVHTRVLELKGLYPESVLELKTLIGRDQTPFLLAELADMQLRHNDPDAIASLENAISAMQSQGGYGPVSAPLYANLMGAYWAKGERAKGLKVALDISHKIIDDPDYRYARKYLPRAALGCLALSRAGAGFGDDAAEVDKVLEQSVKLAGGDEAQLDGLALLAIMGKRNRQEVVEGAKITLRHTPCLEWARWSALYLILTEDRDDKELSDSLPADSLQHRILIAELAARGKPEKGKPEKGS